MNQEELLKMISLGDKEAFHQLYQETGKTVYSFILSILKNSQDAEEVMQETYTKIWTSAASYKPQGKPLAWIFTIARNLCYMKFRDQKRMTDMELSGLSEEELGTDFPPLENLADSMMLQAAFGILKEDERQVVLLHAASGLKHREIAAALGMPLATVLSKYSRAVKKLKQYLGEE